ncbi:sporulation protein YtfJ [Pullulanibacillus pueri]|uniref:Putative spore protein YtfJ n=1 Tax=Pullulanibacillus pueri TaxID=1437324 RepID=A0A8J3ENP0_9BACL|nr:GerW family sporulation protein [Pullulanibacillus pueri]MBM7683500.1 sporulation protein YtfJ [Pullulanibacillus pueri]GGH86681.1 putative spore protein YtfJ [Pullulanibacillus pueri]
MPEEHPIQGLMKTALESLQEMTDVNTIIGDPIETPDGNVILTVSKVGFGFAAGGSEFKPSGGQNDDSSGESALPFGGGSGGGVSITPIAFLIVGSQGIKTIHLDNSTHIYEKLLDLAPQAVDKIQQMLTKMEKGKALKGKEKSEGPRGGVRRRGQDQEEDEFY